MSHQFESAVNKEIRMCHDNIKGYMEDDLEEPYIQEEESSHWSVANKLKQTMDERYPWISWLVIAYQGKEIKCQ